MRMHDGIDMSIFLLAPALAVRKSTTC